MAWAGHPLALGRSRVGEVRCEVRGARREVIDAMRCDAMRRGWQRAGGMEVVGERIEYLAGEQ